MPEPRFETFLQLTKFDQIKGEFTAIAAMGKVVDRSGERFDYVGSKPYFQNWSASQYAASGGKSYGPVRLQHDPKRPAGLLVSPLEYDSTKQIIRVQGKVFDPAVKAMMAAGVLTGVSIGGRYVTKTTASDGIVDYI